MTAQTQTMPDAPKSLGKDPNGYDVYRLPTATLPEKPVRCVDGESAKDSGPWLMRLFKAAGAIDLQAGLYKGRDYLWIKPAAVENTAARDSVLAILDQFAASNRNGAKVPLVALRKRITSEQFIAHARSFLAQHPNDPHIAGAKALIAVFNDCVAGPDGGEVQFVRYAIENTQGIVDVRMAKGCATCPSKALSVQHGLLGLFREHMPTAVQALRIV